MHFQWRLIKRRRSVSSRKLKKLIFQENTRAFKEIDAGDMDLYKVNIHNKQKEKFHNPDLSDDNFLDPMDSVHEYFDYDPPSKHVHIIIKAPEPSK